MKSVSQFAPTMRLASARCMQWMVWGLLACLLLASGTLSAKEYLVRLEPALSPQGFSFVSFTDTTRTTLFVKEPAVAAKGLRRGTLRLTDSQAPAISYLWTADGTLRLDLNRNEDLTDDPSGVFKTAQHSENWGYAHATFTNVLWSGVSNGIATPVTVDLNLWESGGHRGANGNLRTYLSGKLEIEGKVWEVGVIPSFRSARGSDAGQLVMVRPWELRKEGFSAQDPHTDVLKVTGKLFFDGRCFGTEFSAGTVGGAGYGTFKLTEQPAELGELTIAGSHVERLIMEGTGTVAVVDSPGKSFRVPVDRYKTYRVRLGSGTNAAYRNASGSGRPVVVERGKTVTLAVGGPLTNSVDVQHQGQSLRLSYRLVGVGQEPYEFRDDSRENPPRYAIYEGDRKVASGKFEYG